MPVSKRTEQTDSAQNHRLDKLRPYEFHKVEFTVGGKQAVGDCPFCGREGKFSVEIDSGLYRCLVCGTGTENGGGNGFVFIRSLHDATKSTGRHFASTIAQDRSLLDPNTVIAWGIGLSRDRVWTIPGYGTDFTLNQLYRRTKIQDKGKWEWRLLPTPGLWPEGKVHALHMPLDNINNFDPNKPGIIVCEGPWDGMVLWETLQSITKLDGVNVLAVPGCNVWRDEWTDMCKDKNVVLMFDSDHPRQLVPGGRETKAGYDGMVRVAKRLSGSAASVKWLRWGPDGYDPNKKSGWDVRDHLSQGTDFTQRQLLLSELMNKLEDAPSEWFSASKPIVNGHSFHNNSTEALPCNTFADCLAAWKDAMRWRQDMTDALAVVLAVCASTQQAGNQLFLQLIGSAGSGKTTICDGLLVSHHCHHLEHLTGFHSGWKGDDPKKDCSLISRINGKTLITPEADVLLSSPRFQEIMSQQRRIFDGKSGATYKNTSEDTLYVGLRTPWIMAGTQAMMDHDQSHLGDRFLRFIIADPKEDEKRAIIRSAIRAERTALLDRANGTAGSIVDPKQRLAQSLTGGYVDWLRANVENELQKVDVPEYVEDYCVDLAELSADLRARPNEGKHRQNESHDAKELPTRLARQNIRLATCLAVVLNKFTVDSDILRVVRKVALDTAHGTSLNIVQWMCALHPRGEGKSYQECGGLPIPTLESWTTMSPERLKKYTSFLYKIGVLEWRETRGMVGSWVLTERVYELYKRVMNG